MYITDDGRWVGSISGGCLEGDALRKAREIMASGTSKMITYDTMEDDNNSLGVGLGCNGIIHILLEPINELNDPIKLLQSIQVLELESAMATVYESTMDELAVGEKILWNEQLDLGQKSTCKQLIIDDLLKGIKNNGARTKTYSIENESCSVFLEVFQPPIDLLIFGGGFDSQPVAKFAQQLGWKVTVLDECVAHLLPINFPDAQLSGCQRNDVTSNIVVKPFSAAVLMSHNYYYDLEVLRQLLPTEIKYIGILGPKKKGDKMLDELESNKIKLTKWDKHRIHNPIGIDIGGESPEEIAFSIIAEIKAKFSGRSAGFLKYKAGPIHDKGQTEEVFKQVYISDTLKRSKRV